MERNKAMFIELTDKESASLIHGIETECDYSSGENGVEGYLSQIHQFPIRMEYLGSTWFIGNLGENADILSGMAQLFVEQEYPVEDMMPIYKIAKLVGYNDDRIEELCKLVESNM